MYVFKNEHLECWEFVKNQQTREYFLLELDYPADPLKKCNFPDKVYRFNMMSYGCKLIILPNLDRYKRR